MASTVITSFPVNKSRLQRKTYHLWLAAVSRKNWTPTDNAKVCSHHFNESNYVRDLAAELMGTSPKRQLKQQLILIVNCSMYAVFAVADSNNIWCYSL